VSTDGTSAKRKPVTTANEASTAVNNQPTNEKRRSFKRRLKFIIVVILLPLIYELFGNIYAPRLPTLFHSLFPPDLKPGYDFIDGFNNAEWSNGSKRIKAMARRGDVAGFVSHHTFPPERLADGTKCETFLLTHPEWAPLGRIEGSYGPFKISKNNLKVQCKVGFLPGREATKGVKFRVYFEGKDGSRTLLSEKTVTFDKKLYVFDAALNQVANKKGHLVLVVQDLGDTEEDWPVWIIAKTVD